MRNLNNLTSLELRKKLLKAIKVQDRCDYFEGVQSKIEAELNRRNRAAVYKVACKVLKNKGKNQFAAAAHYADAVINGSDYFSTDDQHEIDSFYTKSGNPVVVEF